MTVKELQNKGVFTDPEHHLWLEELEVPNIKNDECLVHVRATGVCGSDVKFWKTGHIGDMIVRGPNGLGHESAGVVVKVGSDVKDFAPGDRVAIEPGVPCSKPSCEMCRTGRYNACPDVVFFSTPPYNGTLRRFHAHPAAWLYKIPDSMTFQEGAMLEPLSVALAGVERAGVGIGMPLLITGAGPIGLISLLTAKAAGACPIVITDINEGRLAMAKKLVPYCKTLQIDPALSARETAARVHDLMGSGLQPHVTLECTGVESSIHMAIYASRFGGMVFVIGVGKDFQTVPFMELSAREIDLRYQYRYHETWPRAIRLVEAGLIDMRSLVTHEFSLDKALEALETSSDPSRGSIKCQVVEPEISLDLFK